MLSADPSPVFWLSPSLCLTTLWIYYVSPFCFYSTPHSKTCWTRLLVLLQETRPTRNQLRESYLSFCSPDLKHTQVISSSNSYSAWLFLSCENNIQLFYRDGTGVAWASFGDLFEENQFEEKWHLNFFGHFNYENFKNLYQVLTNFSFHRLKEVSMTKTNKQMKTETNQLKKKTITFQTSLKTREF